MRAVLLVLVLMLAGCTVAQEPETDPPPADACGDGAPPAPAGLTTVPGPGPGMATVLWQPVQADPPVRSYTIHRDGTPFPLGNTLAFGDHGSATYEVTAIDACGHESQKSEKVSGTPLPGQAAAAATAALAGADGSQLREWPVFAADGTRPGAAAGNHTWRVVTGTGNCCENYVVTTPTGRIVDFGGTFLHYSDDEGQSWHTVQTPIPYLTGEGAVVTGPQGDILAVGWSPYTGDQLWSHKYVAADDQWFYQTMPLHQPFYDRAWTTVLKGPFQIGGRTAPYVVLVESNFHGGAATVLLRSLDGLHYAEVTDSALSLATEATRALPALGHDPDMDWMHPISQSPSRPLAPGWGLQQGSPRSVPGGTECTWRLVHEDGSHSCPAAPLDDLPRNQPLYVDGQGNLHHFEVGREEFTYRMMPAGGEEWIENTYLLPEGATMRVHDQKVHAGLDTAVFAMHVNLEDATGDFLYRFRNVTSSPVLEKVMQVGGADSGSDSGLGGSRRYDFMTVGMLPDGRAVLSFTDEEFHPPALAIEQ